MKCSTPKGVGIAPIRERSTIWSASDFLLMCRTPDFERVCTESDHLFPLYELTCDCPCHAGRGIHNIRRNLADQSIQRHLILPSERSSASTSSRLKRGSPARASEMIPSSISL